MDVKGLWWGGGVASPALCRLIGCLCPYAIGSEFPCLVNSALLLDFQHFQSIAEWTLAFRLFGCFCVFSVFLSASVATSPPKGPGTTSRARQSRWTVEKSSRSTTVQIDLSGPNVCGSRCCPGWIVQLKTKQCTKPRCLPRCHNRAVCRRPNICQCRPGFHGHRCELSSITPTPSVWSWTPSSRTSALVTAITAPVTVSPVTTAAYVTPVVTTAGLWSRAKDSESDPKRKYSLRWQPVSVKEAQAALLKEALARGVGGSKITNVLLKHIETERSRLQSIPNPAETQQSSSKAFHTQHGQYTLVYTPASGPHTARISVYSRAQRVRCESCSQTSRGQP
ncbi:hypothetical protein AOLI_G00092410 [Acnodon oligacanthus]